MTRWNALCGWIVAMIMVIALAQPIAALAAGHDDAGNAARAFQDDGDDVDDADDLDDIDDDDAPAPAPAVQDDDDDDDGFEEDTGDDLSDGDDDDGDDAPAPAPVAPDDDDEDPSAPAPVVQDDDDDDDDDNDGFDEPIPNEAIVQLRSGVDPSGVAGRHGATVLRVIPMANIVQLQLNPGLGDDAELQDIASDSDVLWIESNYTSQAPEGRPYYFFTSTIGEPQIVDAPSLPQGLEYTPQAACATGAGVVVAVLDTGVDATHPAIAAAVLPNGVNMVANTFAVSDTGNGVDDDSDGRVDELVGHGTHVTGTVLQVAPGAQILPVKVLNSDGVGDTFSVTAGIIYAVEQGADIINLSLGSTFESMAIQTAVEFASNSGVVVVAAAGNGDHQEPVEFPAAEPAAISVAATTATAGKAPYSNYHQTVDISAPGNDVASAYPGGIYTTASGTSMSTPLVSGAVALLLERQPGIGTQRVLEVLQTSSGPLNLSNAALRGLLGSGELDIDATIACGG